VNPSFLRRGDRLRREREREQLLELEARLATAEERSRIARELHDVLAHSVSVMTVQTSAVRRLLQPEQEREREALLAVEETGRQALAEMRRLLAGLRERNEIASRAPAPGLAGLPDLVEQVRSTGVQVDLTVEGLPVELPPGVDLSAYRIVQAALGRGGHSHASVAVRYGEDDVEIEVANDGDAAAANGLVGVRERVALCGGVLDAGPRPEGGYRISARLPARERE
jgi:signal transduction histidine kinase